MTAEFRFALKSILQVNFRGRGRESERGLRWGRKRVYIGRGFCNWGFLNSVYLLDGYGPISPIHWALIIIYRVRLFTPPYRYTHYFIKISILPLSTYLPKIIHFSKEKNKSNVGLMDGNITQFRLTPSWSVLFGSDLSHYHNKWGGFSYQSEPVLG